MSTAHLTFWGALGVPSPQYTPFKLGVRLGSHICELDASLTASDTHNMGIGPAFSGGGSHVCGVAAVLKRVLCIFRSGLGVISGKNSHLNR